MKKFLTAVALSATLVPAAFAGQHAAAGFGGHHRAGAQRMFAQLNLTEEQKAQIKAIHEADRQANQALHASLKAKMAEFRQLKQANDPKADAVKTELKALREQASAARQATHQKVLAVLTPEQQAQVQQHRGEARAFAAGHRAGEFAGKLNLTDDQKAQIRAIREASRQQNQALFTSFRAKMTEFRQLKKANDPKADAVKAELQAMKPQVKAARTAARDKMLSVLTPEQRTQLQQHRRNH